MGASRADGLLAGDGRVNAHGIGVTRAGKDRKKVGNCLSCCRLCVLALVCLSNHASQQNNKKTTSTPLTPAVHLPYPCAVSFLAWPASLMRVSRKECGGLFCYCTRGLGFSQILFLLSDGLLHRFKTPNHRKGCNDVQ